MNTSDLKVLLVDDDPAMLRLLGLWLEKAGYPVKTAPDGRQALAAIQECAPDVVITDWDMPVMNGPELCRAIRGLRLPHYVHIVFLTVKSSQDEVVAGLELGADDFLTKPVHQSEMLARLQAASRVIELERRLSQMARTDSLTGLLTQRTLYELLEMEWQRADRFHHSLSCVMMDLDYFKRINDIHGHPAGDVVLKRVGALLQENCRATDIVSRYGGEEFCVLLPETTEADAAAWAERMRARLAATPIRCGDTSLQVTGTFGAAERSADTRTAEALVDSADQALLCAKRSGRDRVVRYQAMSDVADSSPSSSTAFDGLFGGIEASHVMTPLVGCLRDDNTIGQAADFFLRTRISSTPVIDSEGQLAGIVSERDIMAAMATLGFWERRVGEIMKPNVVSYSESTPIRTIYEFLSRVSIRRVVIVRGGCPLGTISRATLLRWYRNLVIAKGIRQEGRARTAPPLEATRARCRVAETAGELARQANELKQRFRDGTRDLMPHIVGGATGMQELCNDLLAYSQLASNAHSADDLAAEMLIEGIHSD
ncbi:MAG: diguanylate cyclase [Planctomycetota bacterium]